MWSMSTGEGRQVAVSSMGGETTGMSMTGERWGSSILAGLPHLLIWILMVVIPDFVIRETANQIGLQDLLVILFSGLLLGTLIYNLFKGWKSWSGSWIMYLFIMAMAWLNQLFYQLTQSTTQNYALGDTLLYLGSALLLAYVLYKITCKNRLWGLLSAIPPMVIIWNISFFLEFVPARLTALAHSWLFLLAFIAAVWMLRTKRFWSALALAMVVPTLGGFPIAYLEIYGAGPGYFPEPNLTNVFRQYLPYLVLNLAIVLGPQLAVKLRSLGYETAQSSGKVYYRLVLGGILCGLVYSFIHAGVSTGEVNFLNIPMQVFLAIGIILSLLGIALLFVAVYKHKTPDGDISELVHLGALFLLLLFLPVLVGLVMPSVRGVGFKNWLIWWIGIAWVIGAGIVVKD